MDSNNTDMLRLPPIQLDGSKQEVCNLPSLEEIFPRPGALLPQYHAPPLERLSPEVRVSEESSKPFATGRGPKRALSFQQEELLKILREEYKFSWKEISERFAGKDKSSLRSYYHHRVRSKSRVGWTSDRELRKLVYDYDNINWEKIAKQLGSGVTVEECQSRLNEMDKRFRQSNGRGWNAMIDGMPLVL